jgi:pyruvate,water dikinase
MRFFIAALIITCLSSFQPTDHPCAYTGKPVPYLNVINCRNDFEYLKGEPLSQKYGNVESIKVVYELSTKKIYYANSSRYHYHFDFISSELDYYGDGYTFNLTQYKNIPARLYVLANLNHYTSSNLYTIDFFSGDELTDSMIVGIYRKIKQTTYFGNKAAILLNSLPLMDVKKRCGDMISTVSPEVVYANQKYQSLTNGTAYGRLVRVKADSISHQRFDPHDILLLDGLPNEVPVVAGILTAEFQTPLCHVSILCRNRGTPNASSKSAWTDKKIAMLEGEIVKFHVTDDGFSIDKSDSIAAIKFYSTQKGRRTTALKCNEEINTIQDISAVRFSSLEWAGGKAANFGELTRIRFNGQQKLLLPESAFVIPFYFYKEHIRRNNLQPSIDSLIDLATKHPDDSLINQRLKAIRSRIRSSPVSTGLLAAIESRVSKSGFASFRFRSSTNAEDIPGFNGAGLYTSKTGILNDTVRTIEKAIKDVWASVWDERAFAEREFFRIDEHSVAMGILAHRSFGTEKVNGVAITRNLYRNDYSGFTVNAQKDEISVVFPPEGVTCDQFLILDEGLTGEQAMNIDYITHSSENGGKPVMTQEQITLLSGYLDAIKRYFYYKTPLGRRKESFDNFAMDVEFKIDSKTGKLYIKQARHFQ